VLFLIVATAVLLALLVLVGPAGGADIEAAPIHYNTAPADNAVERLRERLRAGDVALERDEDHGYLRSLLRALDVPEASQVLVFSKTSLQRHRISPKTPRALYFNDEVYVGFCRRGDVVELTATDPQLGAVFYTLDQREERPRLARQTDACLTCHGSSQNQGFPGHLLRSVFPDRGGLPILSAGSSRIDQTSPLKDRWGGWYVTGTSGQQVHRGNMLCADRIRPEDADLAPGTNVTDLRDRFTVAAYPTPHSDIVALMVLEHQAEMHNRITRANFLTRIALAEAAELNKALGRPADYVSESTASRVKSAGEPLVKYLLFSGEAKLTDRIEGTSDFAAGFAAQGPRDGRGRSLRDFDLGRRLFKYPCSYLIYSEAFAALPGPVKDYVWRRLDEVLVGKDVSAEFAHLSADDRRAIREILADTLPGAPDSWQATAD
jgi:hypothetical protein